MTVGDALETLNPSSRRKVQYLQQNKVYLYCLLKVQLFHQSPFYNNENLTNAYESDADLEMLRVMMDADC